MTQKATKKEIHDLADKKGIPWDNDPKFKKWSKGLTGKSHLDDMSPEQLARLKKALGSRGKKKSAEADLSISEPLDIAKALGVAGAVGKWGGALGGIAASRFAQDALRRDAAPDRIMSLVQEAKKTHPNVRVVTGSPSTAEDILSITSPLKLKAKELLMGSPEKARNKVVEDFLQRKKGLASVGIEAIGPMYVPKTNTIFLANSNSPAALAHELGHASGGLGKKLLQSSPLRLGVTGLGIGAALKALSDVKAADKSTNTKEQAELLRSGRNFATASSAALAGPLLLEEARANMHALKAAPTGSRLALLRKLGPGFSTYAAKRLPAAIALPAALELLRRKAAKNKEKNASLKTKTSSMKSHTTGALSQKRKDRKERFQRGSAFGVGFAAPVSAGWVGKRTISGPFSGKSFEGVADLAKAAQPGDLLMVGQSKPVDIGRTIISLGTGLPHGYHAAIVGEVSRKKGTITIYDLTPKGYRRKEIALTDMQHYSLFRPKSPKTAARARVNMMNLVRVQETLISELKRNGMHDRAIKKVTDSMYNHKMNPVIGVRELFIPYVKDQTKANTRAVRKTERTIRMLRMNVRGIAKDIAEEWSATGRIDTEMLKPMQKVCTNTAALIGIPVGSRSRATWAGPNDFLRSGKIENVGYRVSPRYRGFVKYFDKLLVASPHMIRAGVGLGFGSVMMGYVAAKQWSNKKKNRKLLRKGLRFKRQIFIKGYTRSDGSVVKGHTKTAEQILISRKNVSVVPKVTGRTSRGASITWTLMDDLRNTPIGVMKTKGNQVSLSHIHPKYRGQRLGRKLYGEVMRQMPGGKLRSDSVLSPNSTGVWKSLLRGDTGIKGRETKLNLLIGSNWRKESPKSTRLDAGYLTKLRSQFSASVPKKARVTSAVTSKIAPTVAESLTRFGTQVGGPALYGVGTAALLGMSIKDQIDYLKRKKQRKKRKNKTKKASYQRGLQRASATMSIINSY